MDQQPKIPTLKDAQKPQVKIKGMGAGLTLFDRLKQFKKKDLAFILAGLGTLFMAPLAEHFMMAPENGDASLQQGWGKGGTGSNLFGSGSSPYESGNNNIASGGAIGGSGDIITPLNVRDPSALVMGPGGTQQPPAGSAAPPTAPAAPARSETDYKDALAGAASRAASAAVKKAPLPVPKVSISNSGLRGLGVAGGGSSASGGLLPVGPAAGSTGGGGGSGLNLVRATPNFKGVAGGRSPTGGTGLDNTKRAGANAGDAFNRAGSAAAGLNAAASEAIPTAGQGYGGGGHGGSGANDKPGSGTGPGGSKSVGESLAFIEAKERMMEKLKLEFEKRKLKDPELLLYGIRNDVLKASAAKIGEGLTTWGMCKGLSMGCPAPDDDYDCGGTTINKSQMTECKGGGKEGATPIDKGCWTIRGSQAFFIPLNGGPTLTCNATGKSGGAAPNPNAEGGGVDRVAAIRNLGGTCKLINTVTAPAPTTGTAAPVPQANPIDSYITKSMKPAVQGADVGRVILEGGAVDPQCGAVVPPDVKGNAVELIEAAKSLLSSAVPAAKDPPDQNASKGGALQQMSALVADGKDAEATKKLAETFATAEKSLVDAEALIGKAEKAVGDKLAAPDPKADNGGANIDAGVTTNVTSIQRAQAAVLEQAGSLKLKVKDLKDKIGLARTDIGDDKGTGSLHDTVRLNKSSAEIKVDATAQAKLDTITASSPAKAKETLDASHAALDKANKMLPIPEDPKTKKPDEGKKSLFETERGKADTALAASRKEQTAVIKGYSDYVDGLVITKVLR